MASGAWPPHIHNLSTPQRASLSAEDQLEVTLFSSGSDFVYTAEVNWAVSENGLLTPLQWDKEVQCQQDSMYTAQL